MRKTLILARRELASYFFSPVAYIIGALFTLASGFWFFHKIFIPGNEASLKPLFDAMAYIMVFVVPLLTMRLLSEEYRSGTIETLITAPITDTAVVLGKFLGVFVFYVAMLAVTLVFLGLMAAYGQPDMGLAGSGYLGLLLLGASFIAVGIFTSTITRHQLLAAIVAIAILSVFAILMQLVARYGGEPYNEMAVRFNAMTYYRDFSRGIIDTRGVVFFVSATALFLFLSVKTLESRRWR